MPGVLRARSLACRMKKAYELATTGTPKRSGIPCAMVVRLIRDLPGVPGLLATAARNRLASWIPASGDQDHTISPSASNAHRLLRANASIASRAPRS